MIGGPPTCPEAVRNAEPCLSFVPSRVERNLDQLPEGTGDGDRLEVRSSGRWVVLTYDGMACRPRPARLRHLLSRLGWRPRSLTGYRCKCPARPPLSFEDSGDPARRPAVPMTAQESARWEASCAGCGTVHLRSRKPKAGVWRCKCPHRSEITWRPRPG